MEFDVVNKAKHYNQHPSGIECIVLVRRLPFDLGNCFKYVFRRKGKEPVRSLESAVYYLKDFHATAWQSPPNAELRTADWVLFHQVVSAEDHPVAKTFYAAFVAYLAESGDEDFNVMLACLERLIHEEKALKEQEQAFARGMGG